MNQGWIKVDREILDSPVFKNPNWLQVYLYCLLRANFKESVWDSSKTGRGSTVIELKKGEFILGRHVASSSLNMPESSFYKIILRLEKLKLISLKSSKHFTIVTICNYNEKLDSDTDKVASKELTSSEQVASKWQASSKQVASKEQASSTVEESKNFKNEEKEKNEENDKNEENREGEGKENKEPTTPVPISPDSGLTPETVEPLLSKTETVSDSFGELNPISAKDKTKKAKPKSKKPTLYDRDSPEIEICREILRITLAKDKNANYPGKGLNNGQALQAMQKWADKINLIFREDKRTLEEVYEALAYLKKPESLFIIQCADKFRKRLSNILINARRTQNKNPFTQPSKNPFTQMLKEMEETPELKIINPNYDEFYGN